MTLFKSHGLYLSISNTPCQTLKRDLTGVSFQNTDKINHIIGFANIPPSEQVRNTPILIFLESNLLT